MMGLSPVEMALIAQLVAVGEARRNRERCPATCASPIICGTCPLRFKGFRP